MKAAGEGGALDYRPQKIGLSLTDKCNSNCTYCSASVGPSGKEVMPMEIVNRSVREGADADIAAVVLTGGEPTTHFDLLMKAIRQASEWALALAIQTNAKMPAETAQKLIKGVGNSGWRQENFGLFQFNLSYALSRSPAEIESLVNFVRLFGQSRIRGEILIEALHDQPIPVQEGVDLLNRQLGDRLVGLKDFFLTGDKKLNMIVNFPLMLGRARVLREMPLGQMIREACQPLDFSGYRRLEQFDQDVIAVDPFGYVYPSGLYMYMGIYPIGNIRVNTLTEIIEEANCDPFLIMVSRGRAGQFYDLAKELFPEFAALAKTCAVPFEVFADILEEPVKALAVLDKAADQLIND
jgi:hypothetical protein